MTSEPIRPALKLFDFDEAHLESRYVERIWRTWSQPADAFVSVATTYWAMVITRQRDQTVLYVRGPETHASLSDIPQGAEFLGIPFRLGAFMPSLSPSRLVDGLRALPAASDGSVWLNGSAWQLPTFENADVFVSRLVREGLLVHDPVVAAVLQGDELDLSPRTIERHVLRATGLTRSRIRQVERAQRAVALLDAGESILDTVAKCGYADHAHLTRSLKRFMGQTPSEIIRLRAPSLQ